MKRNKILSGLLYTILFGFFATIMMTFPLIMGPFVVFTIAYIIYES